MNGYLIQDLMLHGLGPDESLKEELLRLDHPLSRVLTKRIVVLGQVALLGVDVSPQNRSRIEVVPGSQGTNEEGTPTCQSRRVGGRGCPKDVKARFDAQIAREVDAARVRRERDQSESAKVSSAAKAPAETPSEDGDDDE